MTKKGRASDLTEGPTVDRLIQELGPLAASGAPPPVPPAALSSPSLPAIAARPRRRWRPIGAPMEDVLVWMCVGLGVALGIALVKWPYGRDCGWSLGFYLYSVGILIVAGVWGVLISWKSRLGFAHTVALVTVMWGLLLLAQTTLPRVGYAKAQAGWTCPVPTSELHRSDMVTEPAPLPVEPAVSPGAGAELSGGAPRD